MKDFPEKQDTLDPFPISIMTDTGTQILIENAIQIGYFRYENAVFNFRVTSKTVEVTTFYGEPIIEYTWEELLQLLLKIKP